MFEAPMRISISIPESLVRRIDHRARKAKTNRSRLIARGLEALLKAEERKSIAAAFDAVFADAAMRREQAKEAALFDRLDLEEWAR
jgi:metal-responsive CopG/Arc/MetJ family transcriptional regulator